VENICIVKTKMSNILMNDAVALKLLRTRDLPARRMLKSVLIHSILKREKIFLMKSVAVGRIEELSSSFT
jgi:hypothetical protein